MSEQPTLPISVCLIAGNEAHRIRRALTSVFEWAAEIIIVLNAEVNDGTDRIAETYGAKVFREPWKGHIAQKNSAAQKATQPWILGLDADEEVSLQLRAEIQAQFADPAKLEPFQAFSFPRCTLFCGRWIRHGDWYPDRKTRLWRRGAGEWGGVNPHDKLIVNGAVSPLNHDLWHYSMEGLNHYTRKTISFSDLFVQNKQERGLQPSLAALVFRPWWRFVRSYFLRMGFLDGWQGYVIARMIAFETFLRYAKIQEALVDPVAKTKQPHA